MHPRDLIRALGVAALILGAAVACGGDEARQVIPDPPIVVDASALTAEGFDPAVFEDLVQAIGDGDFGALDGVIVARNGNVVFETYLNEFGAADPHRMYSVTKSITSLLIGIAIDRGEIADTDLLVRDAFPEYPTLANADPRKDLITLEDLLRMRAGFEWDEWSLPYTHPDNDATTLWESTDWMKHMLDLPMADDPGDSFLYNSGVTMLLSGIIRNRTGRTAEEYAALHLFAPLGISTWDWEEGPDRVTNTGWGSFLRPRDMLTIGEMVRNGGRHHGTQVVSEAWVTASTATDLPTSNGAEYGYQWWGLRDGGTTTGQLAVNDLVYAGGWGGQYIVVIPHLELTVILTASNYSGGGSSFQVLSRYVLPALSGG